MHPLFLPSLVQAHLDDLRRDLHAHRGNAAGQSALESRQEPKGRSTHHRIQG
jgi:hypothetical protein